MRGDVGVLEKNGALKKLPAVKAGAQNEMTIEQCTGFAKQVREFFAGTALFVAALCERRINFLPESAAPRDSRGPLRQLI